MSNLPRWGLVTAAPHQHLVHIRGGRVVRARQGGSCWRWPGDTVALVDTSVHRLQFTADQVTQEKAGVQVTGLAVFRVVQPLLAYRMLNLDEPDAHHEILREMLLGATRRLVANLSLEQCITQRKHALAAELMAEVAPVVAGTGRDDDRTSQGWGIAIDTIEVQDVRVLSAQVFQRLQAPWREALSLKALEAKAEVARREANLQAERGQALERRRTELMALEAARLEAERARAAAARDHEAELSRRAAIQAAEQAELRAASAVRVAEREAEADLTRGRATAEVERMRREAQGLVTEGHLQELLLTRTLPEVAQAFRDSYDQVVLTGGGDLSFLGDGLTQVLAVAKTMGVKLPTRDAER